MIYLTLISQTSDSKVKITPKFKSDIVAPRKIISEKEKEGGPTIAELIQQDEDEPKISTFEKARLMDVDNIEKMLDEKGLTTKENIRKILIFVDKIQDDET